MSFESWQQAWREDHALESSDPSALQRLAREVRGKARSFERLVFWRDAREVAGAALVAGVFGWVAWLNWSAGRPSWTCWIAAALPLAVATFLLVDRQRARRASLPRGESVAAELDRAIGAARHQHWLLTNVAWWYLLPLGASVSLIALHVLLYASGTLWVRGAIALVMVGLTVALNAALWRLNRRLANGELRNWIVELEDRRRQLAD